METLKRLAAIAMLTLAAQPAAAQEAPPAAAQAANEQTGFRIIPLWSTDPDGFLAAWGQPTPPTLATTLQTVRNQPIQQFILYANCARNEQDRCHLRARVTMTAPDGSAYGEPIEFDALPANAPVVPQDRIGLAPNSVGIRVDDDELLGFYTVDLELTDMVSGVKVYNTVQIEVGEAP